jgi:hypothetical protein
MVAALPQTAFDAASALANVIIGGRGGVWEIEDYTIKEVDRETIEDAARDILGWEPPPQEIETAQ